MANICSLAHIDEGAHGSDRESVAPLTNVPIQCGKLAVVKSSVALVLNGSAWASVTSGQRLWAFSPKPSPGHEPSLIEVTASHLLRAEIRIAEKWAEAPAKEVSGPRSGRMASERDVGKC
jgi:hypothetical protein